MNKYQLLFYITFSLLISYTSPLEPSKNTCDELLPYIYENFENITDFIDNNIYYLKKKYPLCIEILSQNGRLEALDYFLEELDKRRINHRKSLENSMNTLRKKLENVQIKHRDDNENEVQYQNVFPAFQWAQNLENIFIEIKYAHKYDSPGCLEIENLDVNIREKYISFTGNCILGDIPIKIDFSINTFKKINVSESTHGSVSVGRYTFTLKKEEKGYWEKLLAPGQPVPPNMRVWFAMKEKYADELKEFEEKNEDKDYEELAEEAKKKEEKNKKEKKEKKKKERKERKKEREKKKQEEKIGNNTEKDNSKEENNEKK